ncbi:MAG: YceI family protein [Rhodocyclaceae bacterium]
MKKCLLVSLLVLAMGSASAAPETFVIDGTHTAPRFEYNHFGYSNQLHRFDKTSGKIVLDRVAKTASVEVVIDAKSVNTGYEVFNGHLQGEDFFDTAKHGSITFRSTHVQFEADKPVAIEGVLTIKGISKPVTLAVTHFQLAPHPVLKRDAVGGNATAKIKRSDFGMPKYAPYVSDEVTLILAVEAIKA